MQQIKTKLTAAAYSLGGVNWPKLFLLYDSDGTGDIGKSEFKALIRKDAKVTARMLSDEMLEHLFWSVDTDTSGRIAYPEFLAWLELTDEIERDANFLPIEADLPTPRDSLSVKAEDVAAAAESTLAAVPAGASQHDVTSSHGQTDCDARRHSEEVQRLAPDDRESEPSAVDLTMGSPGPSAADAAAGAPAAAKSLFLQELRNPEASSLCISTVAIEKEMDAHLRSLEAEEAAIANAATEIQRRMRGHLSRRNGRNSTCEGFKHDKADSLGRSDEQAAHDNTEGEDTDIEEELPCPEVPPVLVESAVSSVSELGSLHAEVPPLEQAVQNSSPCEAPEDLLSQGPGRPLDIDVVATAALATSAQTMMQPQ
jgi:hypothetical protein